MFTSENENTINVNVECDVFPVRGHNNFENLNMYVVKPTVLGKTYIYAASDEECGFALHLEILPDFTYLLSNLYARRVTGCDTISNYSTS